MGNDKGNENGINQSMANRYVDAAKVLFHPGTYISPANCAYVLVGMLVYFFGGFPYTEARRACSTPIRDSVLQWVWQEHRSWIFLVYLRNLTMTFVVYNIWHWLLYESDVMKGKVTKFNPVFPPMDKWRREKFMTMSGSMWAASLECVYIYLLATERISCYLDAGQTPLFTALFFIVVAFWSDIHFYFVHRVMHPWGKRLTVGGIDVGKILFKYVHSYHHLAHNPGPWSGLAMHPVEHWLYFSRSLLLFVVCAHPWHFLFCNIRAQIGPAPGHHGFKELMGSRFHFLHHQLVHCNYGTRGTMDILFGTFKA